MKLLRLLAVLAVMLVLMGVLTVALLWLSSEIELTSASLQARLVAVATLVSSAVIVFLASLRIVSGLIFGIGPGEVGKWFRYMARHISRLLRLSSP